MSTVQFDQMPNFRPVYTPTGNDSGSKRPKLFRSSRPDFLLANDLSLFNSLGIKCIIDCRSFREYTKSNGSKLIDLYFPVYKLKLPFTLKHDHNQPIEVKPVYVTTSKRAAIKHTNTDRRHILVDFFRINYIWAIYNRASIFVRVYSMLYLVLDVILNTGFKHFVRCFARNVLNNSGLGGQYIDMVRYSQASICAALKIISDERNLPAMINCAHGKDRTGIVSAMVLGVLGQSNNEITESYALSNVELEPIRALLLEEIVDAFHMDETFTRALPESMMQALTYIDTHYGSIPQYLSKIGFSMEEQARLRQALLC